jgi:hypothetical protein
MSTEEQQPTVAPAQPSEEPKPADNGTTANGEAKKNGAPKKEPEPPKDPKTETEEWVKKLPKEAAHKVLSCWILIPLISVFQAAFYVADWAISQAYTAEDPAKPKLPESRSITRGEFVNYFKDGVILARLANKLKPGAIEQVKEGEDAKVKENQKANSDAFIAVAKEHLPENQVFGFEDLEKGKKSFPAIFTTLVQLILKTPEQLGSQDFDLDQIFKELSEIVPKGLMQKASDYFNYARNTVRERVSHY